jgi:hypothetical protein
MVVACSDFISQSLAVEQPIRFAELVKYPRKRFYFSAKAVFRYCTMVLSPGAPLTLDAVGIDLLLEKIHCASGKSHMSGHHGQFVLKLTSVGQVDRKAGIATRGCTSKLLCLQQYDAILRSVFGESSRGSQPREPGADHEPIRTHLLC